MKLIIERGKHLNANMHYVHFAVLNPDIMAKINDAPLRVQKTSADKFEGKIFGVKLSIIVLKHEKSGRKGSVTVLSDVRMPMLLGRTYTTASQTYYAIDDKTTSFELKLDLEVFGLMALYMLLRKKSVDGYINRVCSDIENAANVMQLQENRLDEKLDESQKDRVCRFKKFIPENSSFQTGNLSNLEASINVSQVNDIMLIEADAIMPDKHFLTAKNQITQSKSNISNIINQSLELAKINNPFMAVRGCNTETPSQIEFRQAAFELGYKLYCDYFGNNLKEIMPVLLHHGKGTSLRFDIDESLQSLPWEALHDGKDFIATKLRFTRSLGQARQGISKTCRDITKLGILLVGSNSRGDLPGTTVEIKAIERTLKDIGVKQVTVLCDSQANRKNLIELISSGEYNVLHFSGHSVFNSSAPYQSYLELTQQTKLSLHEIDDFVAVDSGKNPLSLVFLNSCQSGMTGTDQTTGRNLSFCRMFRESGVDSVIGMLWNVSDEAAAHLACVFYKFLAAEENPDIPEIMRKTRSTVAIERAWQDGSWLAPVLYT